jgi:hypothetical protein
MTPRAGLGCCVVFLCGCVVDFPTQLLRDTRPSIDGNALDVEAVDSGSMYENQALAPNGTPCTTPDECVSGLCVDGVCCNTTCIGTCKACDLSGKKGTCTPIPAGKDPDNECTASDAETCGDDGTCDGKGACRKHPAGTTCAPGQCSSGETITGIKECDGHGACLPAPDVECFPYECNPGLDECFSSCTDANESSHCYGYYGCDTATGTCYSSCTSNSHCNSSGGCSNGQCVND